MQEWRYEPVADLGADLRERLQSFPRPPDMWMYALRTLVALAIRGWLRSYHRFRIHGRERLPIGRAFVLVANHQSHLDALALSAAVPFRYLHRTFPAAAADYFFRSLPRSIFSAIVVNGLPFERESPGGESLAVCRQLLTNPGNILILFPEGTRSTTGQLGRFRSGIGRLLEGSDALVVPCYLEGAYRAFPKGALLPRPYALLLRIGEPRSYAELPAGRETVVRICTELERDVAALGAAGRG